MTTGIARRWDPELLEPRLMLSAGLLKDLNAAPAGAIVGHRIVELDGSAYFVADTPLHGAELWRSGQARSAGRCPGSAGVELGR